MNYESAYAKALDDIGAGGRVIGKGKNAIIEPDTPYDQAVFDAAVASIIRCDLVREVKTEARKRIDAIAPLWKQMNAARENPSDAIFSEIDVIRKKSNMIEAHLDTLTDAEAGAYDIENSPIWD